MQRAHHRPIVASTSLMMGGRMAIELDAQANETSALFDLVDLDRKDVLEVGCGDGRLTWRYFDRTARVTAIDPFEDSIARARENVPAAATGRVDLRAVAFDDFAEQTPPSSFDVVILSWSLC
jgi:2-polyprenyl-3-methyl-5-hydroxy-6-metoxy-1,4-benzoquinol methylase